jgi:hypothetical protein
VTRLTPQQRLDIELRLMEAEQRERAVADRQWADIVECMGTEDGYIKRSKGDLDRWELAELTRRNKGRKAEDLLLRLPDAAYEARRLHRYGH